MSGVAWTPAAREDVLFIVAFIAGDNPDAAQALKDELHARAAGLAEHPRMYPCGRVRGTREMVVRGNYIVVYTVDDAGVRLLRVLHATRQWP